MLLGPGLSPSREFFFSMHSFLCGGFAVMVALVLLTLVPGIGLQTTLFLGVIFIVLRLVPALLAVGATSSGIAIALASAARIHSLLPSVESVLLELCPMPSARGEGAIGVLCPAVAYLRKGFLLLGVCLSLYWAYYVSVVAREGPIQLSYPELTVFPQTSGTLRLVASPSHFCGGDWLVREAVRLWFELPEG
ncbi:hypothetical protein HID58_079045 [Brassica napus]|uniref:Uncharacterized protein n=1 Tax=Brassica napus TaxID=3708 RepID=A0ABQ7Y0V3_BRANA|nr:hypothetical protein HID58_079045 [Brassica napus]